MTRAAIYVEPGAPVAIENIEPAPPGRRDVVVEIGASGICHSDVSVAHGNYGTFFHTNTILGHEGAGRVLEVGPEVRGIQPGDLVIGTSNPTCGHCWFCHHEAAHLCESQRPLAEVPRGRRANGAELYTMGALGTFAQTMTVNEASVVTVDSGLPVAQLALIGCAVATGVGAVLNTAGVHPGETVAIVGCGGVGSHVVQGARVAGASRIVAVDPVELKRATARTFGATDLVDPGQGDPVAQIMDLTDGLGVDYAFEIVGAPATTLQACEMVRKGGTAVIVGSMAPGTDLVMPDFFGTFRSRGKTLTSSAHGSSQPRRDFQRLADLAEAGRLDLAAMISQTIALDDVNTAFAAVERGEVIRSVITKF